MAMQVVSINNPPAHITGELSTKRVGAYFKQSHKDNSIRVQRCDDGSFFIADGFAAVRVPQHPDLLPFTLFSPEWNRATFQAKEDTATEGGPDIESMWDTWTSGEMDTLTLTHFLWELPGARNKLGKLNRKLATYDGLDERYVAYLDKKYCDMLTPDLDELEGFRFETAGDEQPVRVAAKNGYVAVIMPLHVNK